MMTRDVELFVDSGERIVNQKGEEVSIRDAQALWAAGLVKNYNLAFRRLATQAHWDFAELSRQYAEMDAAQGR